MEQHIAQLTAALGTLWSHAINTRLVLEYTDGNRFLNEDVDLDPSVFPKLRFKLYNSSF